MRSISSRDNQHFKTLKKLCQSGRERRKTGRVVLDGMHLIESYVQHFGNPEEVVVSESGATQREISRFLESGKAGNAISILPDTLFGELAVVETPSGIMAIALNPRHEHGLKQDVDTAVLDGIQDPGNLGSILRSAAAAGFRQVLMSADCAHAWSPKVLRAAMGAHFQLDIHERVDLPAFLLAYQGLVVVTALDAVEPLYSLGLKDPVAWVFGSEGQGVRQELAALTPLRVHIPMRGATESLNVAAAAAICLFETVRQRQTH